MNKQALYTFNGMSQDTTKSKASNTFYFEGRNIRIVSTDSASTGSATNEKGNELVLTIPTPVFELSKGRISYGNSFIKFDPRKTELKDTYSGKTSGTQTIIGHINSRDNIVVMTTDNNGFDCIWEIIITDAGHSIELKYMRDLGFSTSNPIQAVFNYENERIQKVYWVDGKSQLRFINLEHTIANKFIDNLIDVNSNTINIVGNFDIKQAKIVDVVSGGTHTAGMIQYTFNLYRLNSSQTKLAPLSNLIALGKGKNNGGGKVNEIVGSTPIVEINDIDKEYTHIKVYAVKYTSYNEIPTISLIKDQEISSTRSLSIFDDGHTIHDISLSEFLFLGSEPIIPKHIETKDNILFSANITEQNFDVNLDTRAYSFRPTLPSYVYTDVKLSYGRPTGTSYKIDPTTYIVPPKHDAVNLNYDTQKYQADKTTLGGEGKYIKYEIVQKNITSPESYKFFKDNEIYRIGVEFYNRLGQKSFPKWIADFKSPEGNLSSNFNTLKVTLKPEFFVWLNDPANFESDNDKPIGYRVIRADRTLNDRTIITQGFMNSMMSTFKTNSSTAVSAADIKRQAEDGDKTPSLQRVFGKHSVQMEGMQHYKALSNNPENLKTSEVCVAKGGDGHVANTWQYNTLMQMFSPEIIFSNVPLYEGLELRIKGANENKGNQFWGQEREVSTKKVVREGKVVNGLTPHDTGVDTKLIGNINDLCDTGIFGPAKKDTKGDEGDTMDFYQFYRNFTKGFIPSTNKVSEVVYGKPEITEKGQGPTSYNNNPDFKYYNSLEPVITDWVDAKAQGKSPGLTSVNSWGAKCITMMLGTTSTKLEDRTKLERLYQKTGITKTNVMLVGELVKNAAQIYTGNIYGGASYADKQRTNYIQIGDYKSIVTDTVQIDSPGDTFVQNFRFAKLVKTDTEVYSPYTNQITEIVEGKIETSIDLSNRNDMSISGWDSRFQPRYDEYHEYNRVYSQQPTLIQNQNPDYTFVKVKGFDTRIMASKIKVPGENIDNWTDMLVNEVQDLNGKNGPITSLVSFKDNIFAFQHSALAAIGINPRVQVQGGDGVAIELGSGGILHDYKYVTTTSGCINKWGTVATDKGIYYVDLLNNSFCRYSGQVENLSDKLGMHTWFQNNLEHDKLKLDNSILGTGINFGFDIINSDILLSMHQTKNHTIVFNEGLNQGYGGFYSFMDYCPSRYIYRTNRLFSLDDTNHNIYQHFIGLYNNFYGTYYPSYVTLSVNPDVNHECVYNNIEYNSELYLKGADQFDKTITHIQAYNEYQDSGLIPLQFGRDKNLRRKFRTWRAQIPRQGRERLRNPWIYLKLQLTNEDNYKLILHDITVDYTVS